jgi:hypothetical protein
VPSFLLESYSVDGPAALRLGRAAAETATRSGLEVRHVRSFLAPDDEVCFHVFEAPSAGAVARMAELADLVHERITEVIE